MSLLITICIFVFSAHAEVNNAKQIEFPTEIPFTTQLSEDLVVNHKSDDHKAVVKYLHPKSEKVLYTERFKDLRIVKNELNLILGKGQGKQGGFAEVIKNNPELKLSIQFNNDQLFPYIGLLPAGHSIETAMIASNTQSGQDGKHRKGYKVKGSVSSVQAVVLSKDRPQSQGDRVKTNPYQANVIGPFLSEPVSSLPLAIRQSIQPHVVNTIRHENLFDKNGQRFGTTTDKVNDTLASNAAVSNAQGGSNTPDLLVSFEGMDNISGVAPPDTEGTVGPNHFVQMVNSVFAIYDKTGTQLQAPVNINTLWSGFGGACQNNNSGDPISMYDEQADKFVLTQFAVAGGNLSVCFAISATPDPTGSYYLYELQAQRFPDYFKMGTWPVASNNMYTLTTNSGFQGAYDVYALDRENMIAGLPARAAQFFQNYPNLLMPADNDGVAPPADSPALFYTMRDGGEPYFGSPPSDSVDIYEYDIDWNTPANSSLTLVQSLTPPNGDLTEFNWTVCGFFVSNCLPQPGTSQLIDSGSWWPQQRFQYRNFGTYEVLVGTWTVDVNASGNRAAPRWFELRRNVGDTDWDMYQEGTFSPDATHRFSPSISMDASGNIGLGYSVTSTTEFPSIRYTVHDVNNTPLGSMETEKVMKQGTGSETGANRWGDYASMDVDPADGCTFWFTSEYIESNGGFNWQTFVGSFKMPDCVTTTLEVVENEIAVCESDPSATYGLTVSNAFAGTTDMSVTNCPAGGICGFSVNPVVAPDDTTDFEVTDLLSIGAGSYPITVTATDSIDGAITASNGLLLNVFEDITAAPNLTLPVNGSYAGSLAPMLAWDNASGGTDFVVEVDDDPSFASVDFVGMTQNSILTIDTTPLNQSTCYYWRVVPSNVCGLGVESATNTFYTGIEANSGNLMSSDVPVVISASGTPTITSELNVVGVGVFSDVDLVDLDISHTWINDVSVQLTSPEGTTVTLMSRSCDDENNFNLSLDDEAAPGAWPCPPIGGGTYQPSNPLAAFDGENADGLWVLTVSDAVNADGGSLNTWGLSFVASSDPGDQCDASQPPVAVLDALSVNEDSSNNILDVLFNDTDPDGGPLNILSVTQGDNGGLVSNNTSDVSYTPVADFCGLESFSYSLNGGSSTTVEVDVTCLPDVTVANDDSVSVSEDSGVNNFDVTDNDSDADDDAINITMVGAASNGTAVQNGNNIDYTPAADYCGADSFTYEVNSEATATVNVDVTCVNDQPSMSVNSVVFVDYDNPVVQSVACQFSFGPANESGQAVADMNVTVVNDANGILSTVDVSNSGSMSYTLTGNDGVAEVTVALQDNGGVADGGVDTSQNYTIMINAADYIFFDSFEEDTTVCQ
jgi:subtilisin-like proprotein convertase family protein